MALVLLLLDAFAPKSGGGVSTYGHPPRALAAAEEEGRAVGRGAFVSNAADVRLVGLAGLGLVAASAAAHRCIKASTSLGPGPSFTSAASRARMTPSWASADLPQSPSDPTLLLCCCSCAWFCWGCGAVVVVLLLLLLSREGSGSRAPSAGMWGDCGERDAINVNGMAGIALKARVS